MKDTDWLHHQCDSGIRIRRENRPELMMLSGVDGTLQEFAFPLQIADLQLAKG
ncbi:hypothetical protein D3C81_2303750 [compost metagenome]